MTLRELPTTRAEHDAETVLPTGRDAEAVRANTTRLALALVAAVLCLGLGALFGMFDQWVATGFLSIVAVACLFDFILVVRGFALGKTGIRRRS
ncbi:hypothetical protein FPZ12_006615 [Amycolatopsis acidicola]|uniref:Uncharacterized protein n=1 Tax=Amycolatopsis acidicola TaxID=2596893 RepID=A0A5N0VHM1_9PSEU|nr:hypothetical protein [Amycolatopsis acidicola]KAA9164923.1 hypothetical protein FPZ12_006615 [Amycolatopsis acidicola]